MEEAENAFSQWTNWFGFLIFSNIDRIHKFFLFQQIQLCKIASMYQSELVEQELNVPPHVIGVTALVFDHIYTRSVGFQCRSCFRCAVASHLINLFMHEMHLCQHAYIIMLAVL